MASIELDHIFIACQCGNISPDQIPEVSNQNAQACASRMQDLGFSMGSANVHPGQGTSNLRFFIHRFMLEFLYVDDLAGLANPQAEALALEERFILGEASPFGVCSRRVRFGADNASFPYAEYHPEYLPAPLQVQVASSLKTTEPLWFHLPFAKSSEELPDPEDDEPRQHANGASILTTCRIEAPSGWSTASQSIAQQLNVDLVVGERHCLHLAFDGGRGATLDIPEEMPLSITL